MTGRVPLSGVDGSTMLTVGPELAERAKGCAWIRDPQRAVGEVGVALVRDGGDRRLPSVAAGL